MLRFAYEIDSIWHELANCMQSNATNVTHANLNNTWKLRVFFKMFCFFVSEGKINKIVSNDTYTYISRVNQFSFLKHFMLHCLVYLALWAYPQSVIDYTFSTAISKIIPFDNFAQKSWCICTLNSRSPEFKGIANREIEELLSIIWNMVKKWLRRASDWKWLALITPDVNVEIDIVSWIDLINRVFSKRTFFNCFAVIRFYGI